MNRNPPAPARRGPTPSVGNEALLAAIRADLKRVLRAIADYKHPRRIVIRREEFEKTSTGKIKRFLYTMPE